MSAEPYGAADTVPNGSAPPMGVAPSSRGLHSSTFQLNVNAFCGTGGVLMGLFLGLLGVFGGVQGVFCVRNGSG